MISPRTDVSSRIINRFGETDLRARSLRFENLVVIFAEKEQGGNRSPERSAEGRTGIRMLHPIDQTSIRVGRRGNSQAQRPQRASLVGCQNPVGAAPKKLSLGRQKQSPRDVGTTRHRNPHKNVLAGSTGSVRQCSSQRQSQRGRIALESEKSWIVGLVVF